MAEAMADAIPAKVRGGRLARGRAAGPDQPGARRARGRAARPRKEDPLPIFGARPRHGAGAARAAAEGWRRGLRLLPFAAVAARARGAAGRRAGFGHGPRRRLFGRARYRRRVQLSQSGRRACPADVRRSRRAIYPGGRLGAGDHLQGRGAGRRAGGRDRGGARRRRELRHGRILVRANNCDDAIFADAILRRGQWLRHFGSVGLPDAWRRHRRQPRQLHRPDDLQRRRHRAGRSGAADRARRLRMSAAQARAGAAAADRAAAGRPQLPGHADLQERSRGRRRMGARSAAQAQGALRRSSDRRGACDRLEREVAWQVEAARAEAEARGVSLARGCHRDMSSSRASCSEVGGRAGLELDGTTDQPRPRASGSTWSPRSAGCSTRSSPPTRACWCSARMSGRRAGSMR